jgi:glycosyltransferase involved in cell wall biosynthesis
VSSTAQPEGYADSCPLVSIVIPAYNYARYLEEAVESVLAQDYPNVELLVLDDGSTDNTREVLEKYAGRFYWETQENMGQSNTLNRGWRMAKGEILGYLSADDVLRPNSVSVSVEHLLANPQAVLTYCDFDLIDSNSIVIRRVSAPELSYQDMVVKFVCPSCGPGAFFLRSAFEAAGPWWNGGLKQVADIEFMIRLGLQGEFLKIPDVLAGFRVHEESRSFQEGEVRAREILHIISDYFEHQPVPPDVLAARNEALSNAHILAARARFAGGEYAGGLTDLVRGLRLYPRNLTPRTLRLLAYGLFPRARYRLYGMFKRFWGTAPQG